ncbi:Scr1 family TA system antitoxin-like transcriptional regulator [Streptomyces sp. NPDC058335]|uniref:DUF397 domain-containing protein n=1 Tax=Streptomyces sp. NPDC058335 TaxID=3346451 RepID=UPI00364BC792
MHKRISVLEQIVPTTFRAVIHEVALRVPVGGPVIAKRQLQHLAEQSEREHVTIRVIPFVIGAYPGSGQNVHYASGPVARLDTVSLDQSHGPVLVDAEAQLEMYRILLDRRNRWLWSRRSPVTSSTTSSTTCERKPMHTYTWQKSSYCGQGESCVHTASSPATIHLTESAEPAQPVVTAAPPPSPRS